MHSIAFDSLDRLAAVSRRLACPDAVAHQDGNGAWFLDVPNARAAEADALAAGPVLPSKAELIAYAADVRLRTETGGIEVGGQMIDTSRESQNMIAGADALAQADPEEPVDYKAASGWVTLDAATIHAVALAVGRHVRACFRKEREIADAVESGDITGAAEIDAAFAAS